MWKIAFQKYISQQSGKISRFLESKDPFLKGIQVRLSTSFFKVTEKKS